ncbi:MAG: hypothetical protein PHY44_02010 [Lachnospiraceae bacterium]|nr:hypothetical protein [Lachnospiraceae bacterium]
MSGKSKYRYNYNRYNRSSNSRNIYNQNSYNASSEAYAYEMEESPKQSIYDDSVLEEQYYIRKANEIEDKRLTAIEKKERLIHRFKLSVAVLGVFSGCLVTMASYALVAQQRVENSKLNDQLISIQNENASLQAEISDKIDLEYIESEEVNRLGMAEPQPYQIMYIDVPKQSYTVQYGKDESEEKEGFSLASIVSLFKS